MISRRQFVQILPFGAVGAVVPASLAYSNSERFGIRGQTAPELDAEFWIDRNGEPGHFSILESRGKWIYLKCFQDWCPGCHAHGFPALKKVADAFSGDERVAIIGIQTVFEGFSVNTGDKVRKLQLQYDLPITMGHDAGDPNMDHRPHTMRRYRTGGTPWVIIIDPNGEVLFNDYHINADKLIEYWKSVLI